MPAWATFNDTKELGCGLSAKSHFWHGCGRGQAGSEQTQTATRGGAMSHSFRSKAKQGGLNPNWAAPASCDGGGMISLITGYLVHHLPGCGAMSLKFFAERYL